DEPWESRAFQPSQSHTTQKFEKSAFGGRENYAMKTTLGFLTEEGRTRRKNAARRVCVYATFMFLVAGASGYAIHRYWVSPSLTPLQRVYFKQYLKATYRSYFPNSKSGYTTLSATIADPQTKKDVNIAVIDDHVNPVL